MKCILLLFVFQKHISRGVKERDRERERETLEDGEMRRGQRLTSLFFARGRHPSPIQFNTSRKNLPQARSIPAARVPKHTCLPRDERRSSRQDSRPPDPSPTGVSSNNPDVSQSYGSISVLESSGSALLFLLSEGTGAPPRVEKETGEQRETDMPL